VHPSWEEFYLSGRLSRVAQAVGPKIREGVIMVRIAVLGGGASPEHEISLVSASEVLKGLHGLSTEIEGLEVLAVRISREGIWHLGSLRRPGADFSVRDLRQLQSQRPGMPGPRAVLELSQRGIDLVFPALHGAYGEDGRIQALCELSDLPYVGSGPMASGAGMSKLLSRHLLLGAGLPMARGWTPDRRSAAQELPRILLERIRDQEGLRFPWFLKAELSGSSLGIEKVDDSAGFAPALERIRERKEDWLVEEGVSGVEYTVAVLGNSGSELRALPPVEIRPRNGFFDYEAKYDATLTEELCPAPTLDAEATAEIQALGLRAHDVLGCRGFSRSDFIRGVDGQFRIFETNTLPGLTPESLFPKAALAVGLSFSQLMGELIGLAMMGAGNAGIAGPEDRKRASDPGESAEPSSEARGA